MYLAYIQWTLRLKWKEKKKFNLPSRNLLQLQRHDCNVVHAQVVVSREIIETNCCIFIPDEYRLNFFITNTNRSIVCEYLSIVSIYRSKLIQNMITKSWNHHESARVPCIELLTIKNWMILLTRMMMKLDKNTCNELLVFLRCRHVIHKYLENYA